MDEELLYFNGVNGKTGKYGVPAMTGKEVDGLVERIVKPPAQDRFNELKERLKRNTLQQIKQLRDKILSADSAEDLATGVVLPSRWQSSFLQHLALLPVETIKAAAISEVINSVAFEKLMFCLDSIRRIEGEARSLGTWLQDEDLAGIARRIDARDADTQAEARRMLRRFHNLGSQLARRDNGSLLRAPLLETWAGEWAAQILDSNQRIQDALRDLCEQKAPVIVQLES
ncbi:MAG: hypothetical protein JW981_09335, partial [Anaerolineae bacterium]|nr:hypothetical protein [Anaerolineae bacterium]